MRPVYLEAPSLRVWKKRGVWLILAVMVTRTLSIAAAAGALLLAAAFQGRSDGFQRERNAQTGALKDALEGKAPPPLPTAEWLNVSGKPPVWASLKGKVVLLDFWAHW